MSSRKANRTVITPSKSLCLGWSYCLKGVAWLEDASDFDPAQEGPCAKGSEVVDH